MIYYFQCKLLQCFHGITVKVFTKCVYNLSAHATVGISVHSITRRKNENLVENISYNVQGVAY